MGNFSLSKTACIVFVFCAAMAIASPAQTLTTLYSFCFQPNCADGDYPQSSLIQATDGNFYGTTYGGANDGGTVFKITADGTLTTLYNFCSQANCTDGDGPDGALVQAADGNLYGTTAGGGAHNAGTVFKITPQYPYPLTTLYSFCAQPNCADGAYPVGGLVQATDGNFYGTADSGGANSNCDEDACGTVFKIAQQNDGTWTLTTLYNFCSQAKRGADGFANCTDGAAPNGALVQATDGNFYGTTYYGGINCESGNGGCGTVFKITREGALTTLYSFCSQPNCSDGVHPRAGVEQGTDGNFYGTTQYGGAGMANGTVFRIAQQQNGTWTLTTLYSFCASGNQCPDGLETPAGLVQATDGNFYGTTQFGGAYNNNSPDCIGGCGTVFKITPGGTLTTVYTFCAQGNCPDGANPYAGLVQATSGSFYGTTQFGGANCENGGDGGCGTVFSLDAGLGITLSVTTVGSGTVVSSDGRINCGTTCSAKYKMGYQVTLTATPAQDWLFDSWSGCDQTFGNTCTVTMNNSRNVTATFVPAEMLSVTVAGSGTVVSGGINCGSVCSHLYKQGTQVKLTAVPAQGSTLSSWAGCDTMQGDFCTVTMSGARNVTANFAVVQVTLTSLVLKPDSVKGGQTSIATLTLGAAAPAGGLGVGISSDNPRAAHPPSLIVVPGGATSTQFAVRTSPVRQKTVVQITASDNTSQTSAMLTVDPR